MKDSIFKRARKIIKYIRAEGTSRNIEYFSFIFGPDRDNQVPIQIEYSKGDVEGGEVTFGIKMVCRCKMCSIHANHYLCTYKNALCLYKCGVRS